MAETAKKISMIPAKVQYDRNVKLSEKKMKVAAYCRVSTELEEQDSSYEAQVEYYTSKISENENWKNAGIYADDGKSGTNTKKRADFNAMIQDALAGKIDMILTKSVSRFARNTVDSLVTIRKLKEKNVAVVFEKEGINTLEGTGEILITILSSLAQEESRNISENIRWGVVRKFEKGKVIVNCTKFMGYTKNEDGDLVIVPEEAEIVKLIFRLYLEGYSTGKIAKHLEEQGIKTATGQDKWHSTVIDKMLRNEKYMGDALLQKTYTVDFMTKKKVKNTGLVPQYYVEDDHEAIIPKELFYRVQEERMPSASSLPEGILMQGGCHPEEEPEEQVFLHLCTDRHADLRKMRAGVPESHLGEKREKESGLEMQQPADQRSEEMWGIRDTRRERIKQGSDGSHPQDHE